MARAMWSGVIGFGMVSIPIKLYAATESKSIAFHQLHDKCKTRIKELRWCPHCDKQVEWEHIVKGYEYAKGQYVTMTSEDMEKLPLPSKNLIDVSAFVQAEEIDPIYYEKSYYVEPDGKVARAFHLFVEALKGKNVVGIGYLTLRNRERLCALRISGDDTLMLSTLLYPDEIREEPRATISESRLNKQEKDMAYNLIDLLAKDFDPSQYEDHYREALQKVIEAKLEGMPVEEAPEPAGKVVDLMEALRASVSKAKKGGQATVPAEGEEEEEPEAKPRRRASGKTKSSPAAKGRKKTARKKGAA